MATYFGEIMALNSRAIEDFDDESDNEDGIPEIKFDETEASKGVLCDFGVFAFGKVAIGFVNSYVCSDDACVLATVKIVPPAIVEPLQDSGLRYSRKPREIARVLLSSKAGKTLVCEVEEEFPDVLSDKLCEYVLRFCNATAKIVVLMVQHLSMFGTDQPIGNDVKLHCLATLEYERCYSNLGCPCLTPPNVLGNFPAAILNTLQTTKKKAVLYVCFSETNHVAAENSEVFEAFLRLPVFQTVQMNHNAKVRFRTFLNKASVRHSGQLFL